MDIISLRLHNHHLSQHDFRSVSDVVAHMGAVQAQDFAAAKWSVCLRMGQATDASIEAAFNNGDILRTHVLRPTWHFILPKDIRWMLELTAPRVRTCMGHYNKKLELTDDLFARSNKAVVKALEAHTYMTRQELKKVLTDIGIATDVQRLAHIIMWAELDGLICSGPLKGRQFTYALMDTRAPKTKHVDRDKALATLAFTYIASHGPVQLKDFAWWSGLTKKDAQMAFASITSKLASEKRGEKEYFFVPGTRTAPIPSALLVSIFDEYTIAYTDRTDLSEANDIERMIAMGNLLTAVMLWEGRVVGTWKRVVKKKQVEITLHPFRPLQQKQKALFGQEAERYGMFLGIPAACVIQEK